MAYNTNKNVALLSIYPEYANAILEGRKNVEFRKSAISSDVSRVVIYSTSPVQKVVGYFEVKAIEARKPLELWEHYSETAGINFEDFRDYYRGRNKGFGIIVGKVVKLSTPLSLSELRPFLSPPQSFVYLNWDEIEGVLKQDSLIKKALSNFLRVLEKIYLKEEHVHSV